MWLFKENLWQQLIAWMFEGNKPLSPSRRIKKPSLVVLD
jgi:hypothetical protein